MCIQIKDFKRHYIAQDEQCAINYNLNPRKSTSIKRAKTLKSILNTFDELDHETQVKNVVDIAEQIGNLKVLENLRELWEFPTQALQFDFSKLSP